MERPANRCCSAVGWEQRERAALQRCYAAKVALIEGEQPARLEPLCQNDKRRIGEAELQVAVLTRNAEGCAELGSGQALHLECALSQVLQECQLNIDAQASDNQVVGGGVT